MAGERERIVVLLLRALEDAFDFLHAPAQSAANLDAFLVQFGRDLLFLDALAVEQDSPPRCLAASSMWVLR